MCKLLLVAVAALASCHASAPLNPTQNHRFGTLNQYYVYTRSNPREPHPITSLASINLSPLDINHDTAIIIHGHQGSAFTSLNPLVKDAFLTLGNFNVIVVDWSVFANLGYSNAVNAVPNVGYHIAELIKTLVEVPKVTLNRLHIVGFDLGAHVAGFTGRALGGQVARITGLDPVKSLWGTNSPRLTKTDAFYVEGIHTDGDGPLSKGLGTPIGHVDFFPNGGGNQPGCLFHECNHNRSWEFFASTLIFNNLIGNQCMTNLQLKTNFCRGATLHMGNSQYIKFGSGIYRVNTKRTFPY